MRPAPCAPRACAAVAANAEMNDAVKALERALAAALAQAGSETARAGDLQNQARGVTAACVRCLVTRAP